MSDSYKNSDREALTDRRAAVQVPQVIQFVSQFDQFGLAAAVRRVFHLQTLPLLFGQVFVVRHLLNDASHNRSKVCFQLCRSRVGVLHSVMKQSGLQVQTVYTTIHRLSDTKTL